MKKIIRIVTLVMSLVLFWWMIKRAESTVVVIYTILVAGILLIGMEYIKRKANKLYQDKANIQNIDDMDLKTFKETVAQMYKYKGDYVQPNQKPQAVGYDFIVITEKQINQVKCFKSDEAVEEQAVNEWLACLKKSNKIHRVIVTNQYFTEEAKLILEQRGIELVERRELIELLEATLNQKENTQKNTKVQET